MSYRSSKLRFMPLKKHGLWLGLACFVLSLNLYSDTKLPWAKLKLENPRQESLHLFINFECEHCLELYFSLLETEENQKVPQNFYIWYVGQKPDFIESSAPFQLAQIDDLLFYAFVKDHPPILWKKHAKGSKYFHKKELSPHFLKEQIILLTSKSKE